MSANTPASLSMQFLRTQLGVSIPGYCFQGFTPRKADLIIAMVTMGAGAPKAFMEDGIIPPAFCSK